MVCSSPPSAPPSPACGLRPEIASRGAAIAMCRRSAASTMRAVETISSLVRSVMASRSGRWIVTGTTASACDHSIITGCGARCAGSCVAANSARNSVWPGWAKPAWYSTLLAIGLVTTALARPACTSSTAWRIDAIAAAGAVAVGLPGRGGGRTADRHHGQRLGKNRCSVLRLDLGEFDGQAELLGAAAQEADVAAQIEGGKRRPMSAAARPPSRCPDRCRPARRGSAREVGS